MKILGCNKAARHGGRIVLIALTVFAYSAVSAQENMANTIWESVTDGGCRTTLTFLSDKEYMVESKEQIVMKAYKFTRFRKTDFFVFFQRTVANNDQLSCTGIKAAREGTRKKFYAKFNEAGTQMSVYPEPEDQSVINIQYNKRGV